MPDPLAVAQVVCHEVIRILMAKYADPVRNKTSVSLSSRRRLVRSRERLRSVQAGYSRRVAEAVTKVVIDELVKEVLNFLKETSIYKFGPQVGRWIFRRQCRERIRRSSHWKHDSSAPAGRWRFATRHGSESGDIARTPVPLGERPQGSHGDGTTRFGRKAFGSGRAALRHCAIADRGELGHSGRRPSRQARNGRASESTRGSAVACDG